MCLAIEVHPSVDFYPRSISPVCFLLSIADCVLVFYLVWVLMEFITLILCSEIVYVSANARWIWWIVCCDWVSSFAVCFGMPSFFPISKTISFRDRKGQQSDRNHWQMIQWRYLKSLPLVKRYFLDRSIQGRVRVGVRRCSISTDSSEWPERNVVSTWRTVWCHSNLIRSTWCSSRFDVACCPWSTTTYLGGRQAWMPLLKLRASPTLIYMEVSLLEHFTLG